MLTVCSAWPFSKGICLPIIFFIFSYVYISRNEGEKNEPLTRNLVPIDLSHLHLSPELGPLVVRATWCTSLLRSGLILIRPCCSCWLGMAAPHTCSGGIVRHGPGNVNQENEMCLEEETGN